MKHGKSLAWAAFIQIYLLLLVAGILLYSVAYIITYEHGGHYQQMLAFLLQSLPFAYVFGSFLLGLYMYAWYVDMYHLLQGFTYQPQKVLWQTMVPIVQLYGIAVSINKVATTLDAFSRDDEWYSRSQRLLTMLAAFYAAVLAVVIAILFGTTLPTTTDMVNQTMVTVFHLSAAVAGIFLSVSLVGLVQASRSITKRLQRVAA